MLLWEGHHRPPLPLSLIPYSFRNSFAYAETVILVRADRQMQNCINAFGSTRSQKHLLSRWMVYLFVIFMYSVLVTLPSNYRDHVFVSPFLRRLCVLLQWTNGICPWVGLNGSILSKCESDPQPTHDCEFWKEMGLSCCSQTITVYVCFCTHKACRYHRPRHQQVAVRDRGGKIMAPPWIVWIIAMTGW